MASRRVFLSFVPPQFWLAWTHHFSLIPYLLIIFFLTVKTVKISVLLIKTYFLLVPSISPTWLSWSVTLRLGFQAFPRTLLASFPISRFKRTPHSLVNTFFLSSYLTIAAWSLWKGTAKLLNTCLRPPIASLYKLLWVYCASFSNLSGLLILIWNNQIMFNFSNILIK